MKKSILIFLSFNLFFSFSQVKTDVKSEGPKVEDILKYEGKKAKIAVARFDIKAPKATFEMGDGIRDMLIDALFKTGKFIVLEKDALKDLEDEIKLSESEWTQKGKGPEKGLFEGADIIVVGTITGFEPHAEGTGGGGLVIPLPFGGGFAVKKEQAYIQAIIRLIDVRTRRIINSTRVEGKAEKTKTGVVGGGVISGVILGGGFEKYKNTPTEQAVLIMIDNAVNEISRLVPENYFRYGEKEKGYKNEPEGFRNIKWETNLSSIQNIKVLKIDGEYKECVKTDDILQLKKAKLEKIIYRFFKDQLESVILETKGKENFDYLKEATIENFGPGIYKNENEWVWEGKVTTINLRYIPSEEKGILIMTSEEMKKKSEASIGF